MLAQTIKRKEASAPIVQRGATNEGLIPDDVEQAGADADDDAFETERHVARLLNLNDAITEQELLMLKAEGGVFGL